MSRSQAWHRPDYHVIMRIGNMLSIGYERVLLMYNSNIYVTADVLSTFEQRIGILSATMALVRRLACLTLSSPLRW